MSVTMDFEDFMDRVEGFPVVQVRAMGKDERSFWWEEFEAHRALLRSDDPAPYGEG